ncbi:MAG: aminotransferase class I/II-fold pyridoxal phosphate-dependent enzyme [Gallionella sp.]|nr:aminotransferase class I/II-fold pyridoxal phosphate-dependent enzyme [Gallionella sp.]
MTTTKDFALFGAPPAFDKPIPIGQLYFPSAQRYEAAFRGIFERQYYTEYGPLNRQLEQNLQQFLGVKHAICVANETVALMMVANAMELTGKVILPAFNHIAAVQSLSWAGLEPVFCDVDPATHQIDIDQVSKLIDQDVSAILGVNLWGGVCDVKALAKLAKDSGVQLYFDSAHAFGCAVDGVRIGNFGRAEVLSFHQSNILNATEGGCICTNDDELAAKLRVMRSSAGAGSVPATVNKTVNGRMSEAQSAIALMGLEDFSANQRNNEILFELYKAQLAKISGLRLFKPKGVSFSNYQNVVCQISEAEFGLSRDRLIALLKAENVDARPCFHLGVHRDIPHSQHQLPETDSLSTSCIQLPIGALVSAQSVLKICDILARAHQASTTINARSSQDSIGVR